MADNPGGGKCMWKPKFMRNDKTIEYDFNDEGYFIQNENSLDGSRLITVITPVFNAEKILSKTVESVIGQTIGFSNIELILIDDGSSDSSRNIIRKYAKKYDNIVAVFMKENSGTPAKPRNLGIELATSEYVFFLDADDWLDTDGLRILYDILEETGNNYAVGKTIRAETGGEVIAGEHQSVRERRSVSPFTIPNAFQHLGPTARMMRRRILMEGNIRFPAMKFAEDKQFFIDVLLSSPAISTTKKTIHYANRLDDNESSLTSQTSIMEKTDSNIAVIQHVKSKSLPAEQEGIILNRLYEFDCITRLFDRNHFLKSKSKKTYFRKFQEVLDTSLDMEYDISENFFHPFNKVMYDLFIQQKYKELEELIRWHKKVKLRPHLIKDNQPFMVTPFTDEDRHLIKVPILAFYQTGRFEDGQYKLDLQVFGDYADKVNELVMRNRQNIHEEFTVDLDLDSKGYGSIAIDLAQLDELPNSSYEIFIRYDEFRKTGVLRPELIEFHDRTFNFYTTVKSNLGLKSSE
jgi:glycosyltransferase involved in cell wall biosynthesis